MEWVGGSKRVECNKEGMQAGDHHINSTLLWAAKHCLT